MQNIRFFVGTFTGDAFVGGAELIEELLSLASPSLAWASHTRFFPLNRRYQHETPRGLPSERSALCCPSGRHDGIVGSGFMCAMVLAIYPTQLRDQRGRETGWMDAVSFGWIIAGAGQRTRRVKARAHNSR